jgi:hypothetical protein
MCVQGGGGVVPVGPTLSPTLAPLPPINPGGGSGSCPNGAPALGQCLNGQCQLGQTCVALGNVCCSRWDSDQDLPILFADFAVVAVVVA